MVSACSSSHLLHSWESDLLLVFLASKGFQVYKKEGFALCPFFVNLLLIHWWTRNSTVSVLRLSLFDWNARTLSSQMFGLKALQMLSILVSVSCTTRLESTETTWWIVQNVPFFATRGPADQVCLVNKANSEVLQVRVPSYQRHLIFSYSPVTLICLILFNNVA